MLVAWVIAYPQLQKLQVELRLFTWASGKYRLNRLDWSTHVQPTVCVHLPLQVAVTYKHREFATIYATFGKE